MSNLIDVLFKPSSAKQQGPSQEEIDAQKKIDQLVSAAEREEAEEARGRGAILRARRQGPQTLFTRPGDIPRAVTLGAGERRP